MVSNELMGIDVSENETMWLIVVGLLVPIVYIIKFMLLVFVVEIINGNCLGSQDGYIVKVIFVNFVPKYRQMKLFVSPT